VKHSNEEGCKKWDMVWIKILAGNLSVPHLFFGYQQLNK